MTFMNRNANIKQFQLVKFINENTGDDHVMSKISIVLRRDKIEAPYYMVTKARLSTCIDRPDNGLIHAMDILNHQRKHNLTEDRFNEIKSLILTSSETELVKIIQSEKQIKMDLMSRNEKEFQDLFKDYQELFDNIDSLTD